MKKDLKRLGILSIVLIIISLSVALIMGRTYTYKFDINNNSKYELSLQNETGKVKILEEKEKNGKCLIKIKGVKPGKAFLSIKYGDYGESKMIYIHKSMMITDNTYFGDFTGSKVIPISLVILFSYILYILIKVYNKSKKENLYQYRNIALLGIIIFIFFIIVNNALSILYYQGLFTTIDIITSSMALLSYIMFPIAFVTFILVTIINLNLIRKEGISLKNLLGLFLGLFICISTLLPDYIYNLLMKSENINIFNLNGPGPYIYNFISSLIYLTIAYLECILIGTIIIALKSVMKKASYDKDYIIILGCKIKKDGSLPPLLKGRVDRAIQFREEQLKENNKDLIFVPSGGKGKDETISEAEAMKKYLVEHNIPEDRILVESESKNTYENIRNSIKLIDKKNVNIAFSTTNYHVLRAGLIATSQGFKLDGIGSKTKIYFWVNAFIREFIGTIYSERKKHIIVFIFIIIIIIISVYLTYLANNI